MLNWLACQRSPKDQNNSRELLWLDRFLEHIWYSGYIHEVIKIASDDLE